jgi:hypothetical protein
MARAETRAFRFPVTPVKLLPTFPIAADIPEAFFWTASFAAFMFVLKAAMLALRSTLNDPTGFAISIPYLKLAINRVKCQVPCSKTPSHPILKKQNGRCISKLGSHTFTLNPRLIFAHPVRQK